jgi:hypothetical protein
MEDIARNFLGLIFLMGADIIVMAVFVALIIANYLASKSAFDYLGYDGLPLAKEAFIGHIIGPFFPEVTLSHCYAFVVAVVISMGLLILTNRIFHAGELHKERKRYLAQNDRESAQIVLDHIYDAIGLIIAILLFLIPALNWDFHLFRYRSVLGALGIEDPAQAALAVVNWERQMETNGHLFAWFLALVGAFGYLGITGIACVALDFCFRRTTERFIILITDIERIFNPLRGYDSNRQPIYDPKVPLVYDASGRPVIFYGYDSDGYPVYDPQTPHAYDTDGKPIKSAIAPEEEPADGNGTVASSQEHHQDTTSRITRESSQDQSTSGTHNTEHDGTRTSGNSDDSQGSLFSDEEAFQHLGGRRNENTNLKDVIGKTGERVSLAAAMADNERYWVDPDSLEIWDRDYRRNLFPGTC